MKTEKQRIAIAEWCGWKRSQTTKEEFAESRIHDIWVDPSGKRYIHGITCPPNYLNDLNAMHEAEKRLDAGQRRAFAHNLEVIVFYNGDTKNEPNNFSPEGDYHELDESFAVYHATAAQRAEALLKTLGKWEE